MSRLNPSLRKKVQPWLEENAKQAVYRSNSETILQRLGELGSIIYAVLVRVKAKDGLLKQVFDGQFIVEHGQVTPRAKKAIAADSVQNPNDPEAEYRQKGQQKVKGYSVNITETTDQEDAPSLITGVQVEGATAAAMKYTLGPNPYGYRAKGDIYVFLFFGFVAVVGAYFVCTGGDVNLKLLLPGAAVGFFSVGVLNVNNIRDMKTDAANRVTVAIRLGEKNAKVYQSILIGLGWVCMVVFCLLSWPDWRHWLFVITLPLYIIHLRGVWPRSGRTLDPMLPLLVMSTFLFCLLAGAGFCLYLLDTVGPLPSGHCIILTVAVSRFQISLWQ